MLWIKNHRLMTLSLLLVFVCSLLSLFGFVSPSFATSQSFTYDSVNNPIPSYLNPDTIGFNPHYYEISGSTDLTGFNLVYYTRCGYYSGDNPATLITNGSFYEFRSATCYLDNLNFVFFPTSRLSSFTYSITLTFYDDFPDNSEPCPDCPEIPDTPYGDKLDKIYNAIMIAAGTMLVIYFFFAIYSMFFGGLKR